MADAKRILVTGGNAGIGFALCHQLVADHGCRVFLGSRNAEKGEAAVAKILQAHPQCMGMLDSVQIDVSSHESVVASAETVKTKLDPAESLYAIVNNAGTGLAHRGSGAVILSTNIYGIKRVCDAFIPFLHPSSGRIVNVSSGVGPSYIAKTDEKTRSLLTNKDVTWEQIQSLCEEKLADGNAYGLSKAAVNAYTMVLAREYPQLKSSACSPGFVDTAMTAFPGMCLLKRLGCMTMKTPGEGTFSIKHCLFQELSGSGLYFGSDALRSPLHYTRNPGDPEYTGF